MKRPTRQERRLQAAATQRQDLELQRRLRELQKAPGGKVWGNPGKMLLEAQP